MMKKKTIFEKMDSKFAPPDPLVDGPNVFSSQEYADTVGLSLHGAKNRIGVLLQSGEIRRVKTKRNGRIIVAYEYIGNEE